MSRPRHRRLQKTRKRYQRVLQSLSRWRHPLEQDVWDYLHTWQGHGPQRRPTRLDLILSIPPAETPFGQMAIHDDLPHQWMIKRG